MHLYLDSYSAFLSVKNGMFCVRTKQSGEHTFAVRKVNSILMTRGTSMSTDAVLLAVEHEITVLVIDPNTHYPLAVVHSGRPGNIAEVRRNQAFFSKSPDGLRWAANLIADKISAQHKLLVTCCEFPGVSNEFITDLSVAGRMMKALEKELRLLKVAGRELMEGQIRGREGTAARLYFARLAILINPVVPDFTGRKKRPAFDIFNALLNYLYGMLYTQVFLALLKTGLDPFMGSLHADQYGSKPTLAYDAIEPYRPWADEVAIRLILQEKIGTDHFLQQEDETAGLWLNPVGKATVITEMLKYLGESTPHGESGNLTLRRVQIDRDAGAFAVMLKNYKVT